ncbi:MAG: hypothetical protein BWY31_03096 [Lentisphaerae bacterium ADurb.Bin242]|nr:MAG: hypothetical protein BWY31_03096 [Lentisphaerae bacterium ADurb.Bin242]
MKGKQKHRIVWNFTLVELLIVIAIIAERRITVHWRYGTLR